MGRNTHPKVSIQEIHAPLKNALLLRIASGQNRVEYMDAIKTNDIFFYQGQIIGMSMSMSWD